MTPITFEVPGTPQAKQRPRFTSKGRTYTPRRTTDFESAVGYCALPHFRSPLEGPVKVEVLASFSTPKSWSKRKTADLLHRHHCQVPDADNVLKAVMDGLNGVAFKDDAQAAEQAIRKVWATEAKTVVIITSLEAHFVR